MTPVKAQISLALFAGLVNKGMDKKWMRNQIDDIMLEASIQPTDKMKDLFRSIFAAGYLLALKEVTDLLETGDAYHFDKTS